MYELPKTITVNGREYNIQDSGDFRMILDCFSALQDEDISEDARVLASLIIFYEDFDDVIDLPRDENILKSLIIEMYKFFNCGKENNVGMPTSTPLINWEDDAQIICAAINTVANTEVRALPYLHWWTFLGYYMSVGQSVLSTVVSIRDKITHGIKLEKWEQDFRRDNPNYFNWKKTSKEEQEFEKLIREQFHRKGGDI